MIIHGETVVVRLKQFGETDAYGNPIESYAKPVEVSNVVVGSGGVEMTRRDGQPHALEYDRTFYFPLGYNDDLREAIITRDGVDYEAVDAFTYTEKNIPPGIDWNAVVKAVRFDG